MSVKRKELLFFLFVIELDAWTMVIEKDRKSSFHFMKLAFVAISEIEKCTSALTNVLKKALAADVSVTILTKL